MLVILTLCTHMQIAQKNASPNMTSLLQQFTHNNNDNNTIGAIFRHGLLDIRRYLDILLRPRITWLILTVHMHAQYYVSSG